MREKFVLFLIKILGLPRSKYEWWYDIRDNDKKLLLVLKEYDLVMMDHFTLSRLENSLKTIEYIIARGTL